MLFRSTTSPYYLKRVAPYVNDDTLFTTLIDRTSISLETQCYFLDTAELGVLRAKPIMDYVVEYPFETTVRRSISMISSASLNRSRRDASNRQEALMWSNSTPVGNTWRGLSNAKQ